VTFLRWHPDGADSGAAFHEFGLCHASRQPEELFDQYDRWLDNNLCVLNRGGYEAFLDRFNRPFDGQAAGRVRHAIRQPLAAG
jgi:hypothetical protein